MDKQAQIAYFEGLLDKHGANYKALDWNSVESQKLRFKIFKEIFIYGKKSVNISLLDVGCGLGDMYGFLKAEGVLARQRINYTGYDISPRLIEAARKRYPDGKFEVKDLMVERQVQCADYVFCSGVFNIRTTEKDEHLEFVKEMIYRMYDLCGCGLAINFLSEGVLPIGDQEELNASRYFYFSPDQMVKICRFICSRYILRHDYHPNDFTLYLFK